MRRVPTDGPVEMLSAERGGVGDFGCKEGSEYDGVKQASCLVVLSFRPFFIVISTELLRDREGVGGRFPGSSR